MNNFDKYIEFRNKYPNFIFEKYDIFEEKDKYVITYYFTIEGLITFTPKMEIKKYIKNKIDEFANYLIFHIGMIELISYWKATCSKNVIIKANYLTKTQLNWFKKQYFYGLGELFYVNSIKNNERDFMNITCTCSEKQLTFPIYEGKGNIIPIGGGKDSCVTLEVLNDDYKNNDAFIINPKQVMLDCANIAGYENKTITVKRILDKQIIELNKQGFINGHTPFSALVSFTSYLVAYLYNKKYIILSNECSANESTIIGTKINHQYSKTFEYENDFNNYTKKYFKIDIKYFSLLRPLSELQIAMLFSKYNKYHSIFKSCNVGSKEIPWHWCNNCAKCLFVFIILTPFLSDKELKNIFKENLFDKKELLPIFLELSNHSAKKPFECVGTYEEVRYCVNSSIDKLKKKNIKLPYLLEYYNNNFKNEIYDHKLLNKYNKKNNLNNYFNDKLLQELKNKGEI